jgi:hypothetical protein
MEEQASEREWPALDRRRSTDVCEETHRTTVKLVERVSRLERLADMHATAFVKNDLGQPDLDGHRRAHIKLLKAAEAMDDYKAEGAKSLIKLVVTFLAGVFAMGIAEWFRKAG